jgi:hypothetical protein
VPLWNAQTEKRTELSWACRKLNVSIDPGSLNKSWFLLAQQLVLVVSGALEQGNFGVTCLAPLYYPNTQHIQIGMEQTSLTFNHHLLQIRKWTEKREQHGGDI